MLRRSRPRYVRRQLSPVQLLALFFLVIIAIGTLILSLPISQRPGVQVGFVDCLFTATSAVTITGLVTHSTGDTWTRFGQVVIMMLIQLGGIGYMTVATIAALLLGLRLGLRARLHLQEAYGVTTLHDAMKVTRYIVVGTLVLEVLGSLLLASRFYLHHGMDWSRAMFEGVFYSISAFCNAGFDLVPGFDGLAVKAYRNDLLLLGVIGSLIILGSLGFAVLAELTVLPRQRRLSLYVKLVLSVTAILLVIGTVFFYLFEMHNPQTLGNLSDAQQWVTSWFMSATPRSGGFAPIHITGVTPPSFFLLEVLMFIGGSPNSMGGGVKTVTVAIIVLAVVALIRQNPDIEVFKRRISGEMVRLALSLVTVFLLAVVLAVGAVSFIEFGAQGLPAGPQGMTYFAHLLFEVLSAFGTVGLSAGLTPDLQPLSKIVLIFGMYFGRLGPLAFIYIFARDKRRPLRRLPSEPVMAG